MANKEEIITTENKREILWVVINAFLAGCLVFIGAFIDGGLSRTDLIASFGAAAILFLTKISDYWKSEEGEYCKGFGMFL